MENMDKLKLDLADCIAKEIRKEFSIKYLSKNITRNIIITNTEKGFAVIINAPLYDLVKFKKFGVVIYNKNGSYASRIDETGGFSGVHKDYVDRCITKGIAEWSAKNSIKINTKKME